MKRAREIRLEYRTPFDWDGVVGFLATRALDGVESFVDGIYSRAIARDGALGVIRVRNAEADGCLVLTVPPSLAPATAEIEARTKHVFDLGTDPADVADALRDRLLAPLLRKRAGVRVPGAWEPFEIAVRAIVGQQVSVAGARTVLSRIVAAYGEHFDGGIAFPSPERLAEAEIGAMPRARAETIRRLARGVADGRIELTRGASLDETIARLIALPGIGPWTAHYIAMRAHAERDAFPAGDIVLRREAGGLTERELLKRGERWRPFRAYAAMLLWMQ